MWNVHSSTVSDGHGAHSIIKIIITHIPPQLLVSGGIANLLNYNMKKVIFVAGVAVLALAAVSSAAFSTNLTVGSTGADVTALQNWLITNGFSIPAGATGYFGSQTKAALASYQKSVGLPAYGFFGPLTQAKLNGTSPVASTPSMGCPAGYTCTPVAGVTPVAGTSAGITTPGIPGTLVYSLQSTYNGTTLDKSKTVSIARYKLQASASDMAVTSLSFDFDKRLWLYVGAVTITDDNGAVIASKSNLSSADFSELTVGTKYRLTVPVNYIVKKAASQYLTVNVTALSATDRTSSDTISLVSSQARAVDGTGVTDTEVDATTRSVAWSGANNNNLVATIDASSPATKLVQISSSVETDNVVLGVFDIKSQNNSSLLRKLNVTVTTDVAVGTLFNDIKVKIGNNTFSADYLSSTSTAQVVTFLDLNTNLDKDVYVPVTILGKVAKNVSGSAAVSLIPSKANIVAEDSSYNTVTVTTAGSIAANTQTFTVSGVVASNVGYTLDSAIAPDATAISRVGHVKFSLTAGDSAIYVSKTQNTAITYTGATTSATIAAKKIVVDNTSGDAVGYFYIAPGQTKSFTADYEAAGTSAAASDASMIVTSLNYGTTTSATGGVLNSSDIQSALNITFF